MIFLRRDALELSAGALSVINKNYNFSSPRAAAGEARGTFRNIVWSRESEGNVALTGCH
jgi:hypothetical protein